ncbi:DUF1593 domain-containing protein [Halolactibacillus miurensis]|nr:DUF1593 domain-containing protein [Halolactibacillus miurensis]
MLDPELDDLNTIVRYLLYSNHFHTEGIIYSSSRYHWRGDGQGTRFLGESEHSDLGIGPITCWRWDEDSRFIEEAVDIYAKVYQNLSIHAEGYPHPSELRERIFNGNIAFPGDLSHCTQGSEHLMRLILDDEPGPLYVLTGTGQSTIGRALKSIEERYLHTEKWENIYNKVSAKVIIQSFGDQDGIYETYIHPNWPNIRFRQMATTIWGYFARSVVQPEDRHYLSAAWIKENISSVGPFGEFYRVWGDGKYMHKNDITDYFGFKYLTANQLKALGYSLWYKDIEEPGSWISEGDTSMFMNLIDNGLEGHVDASYGGWGGRNGKDIAPDGVASKDYASARWFGACQRDFAARLQWTVTPEYKQANHHPIIELINTESAIVAPGQTITLKAIARDPDGHHLSVNWWQYEEAGAYPGQVELISLDEVIEKEATQTYPFDVPAPNSLNLSHLIQDEVITACTFNIPTDTVKGQTIHCIVEAIDHCKIPLTSYKRIVLTVDDE